MIALWRGDQEPVAARFYLVAGILVLIRGALVAQSFLRLASIALLVLPALSLIL